MVTDTELIKQYDGYYTRDKGKWSIPERDKLAYEAILEFIPEPLEVLDVGCGNGHTLAYFKAQGSLAKLYGIDLSQVAIDIAKAKLPEASLTAGFFTEYDSRKRFQVIVCLGSAEHFTDLQVNLKKMKSLLKKEGICYIEIPNNLAYDVGKHDYRQLRSGSRQYEWHLDKDEWEVQFVEAGFEVKKFYRRNRPQWEFCWVLA